MPVRTGRPGHGWLAVQPCPLPSPLHLVPSPLRLLLPQPHEPIQRQLSSSSSSSTLMCRGLDSNTPILRAVAPTPGAVGLARTEVTAALHNHRGVPAGTIAILRTILTPRAMNRTRTNGVFRLTGTGSRSSNITIFRDTGALHLADSLRNFFPKSLVAGLSELYMALCATLAAVLATLWILGSARPDQSWD